MSEMESVMDLKRERTLIIIKPDGVQRNLTGEILQRLERAGLTLAAMKMVHATQAMAEQHYRFEDIGARHGERIWKQLLTYITSGPTVVAVLEGVNSVAVVRKLCGSTEPASAPAGTIRGDLAHHSYKYADAMGEAVQNLIHASATVEEAAIEIPVWFSESEVHSNSKL